MFCFLCLLLNCELPESRSIAYSPSLHTAWLMQGAIKWVIYEVGRERKGGGKEREKKRRKEKEKRGGEAGVRTCTRAKGI